MRHLLSLAVLLAPSCFNVWSQPIAWIDSNELVQEILRITRADSRYMEELMELHTHNGELDRLAYNEALRQFRPVLYLRMTDFRKIHNELESQDIDAMNFIDSLLTTARDARHGSIWQPQETKT
ncbi:hypothetical protein TELCIR_15215 [Teladorsagia circumcincta]|uniref:Uncharacterized protein n=1 Tax=Teladorsagia circumcincta TaxID=45464 RepID=A0A2G9TYU1_TELCI|nr:hypothetical protein TELCIR_15215 [Teladorsagia circumcincta]